MPKKVQATEAQLKELYDENFFYEYGDNPANKKYLQYMQANLREGQTPDYRSMLVNSRVRWFFTRDFEDLFNRDLKLYTFPRSFSALTCASLLTYSAFAYAMKMVPLGRHGITHISQTQTYRQFGAIPTRLITIAPFFVLYGWFKLFNYTSRRFWNHVILGERNWDMEEQKVTPRGGEYYFKDTPFAGEENFPDLARGEMARSIGDRPSWVSD